MQVGTEHVIDLRWIDTGRFQISKVGIVAAVVPFRHPLEFLVAADAGVDQDRMVACAHQIGLDRQDNLTACGRDDIRQQPVLICLEHLRCESVEELLERHEFRHLLQD